MGEVELPLAEFKDLERVPLPPKPKYRSKASFTMRYEGYIEFTTDDDPNEWLEKDENVEGPLDEITAWGTSDYDGWVDYGPVEVSYDDGRTWETHHG